MSKQLSNSQSQVIAIREFSVSCSASQKNVIVELRSSLIEDLQGSNLSNAEWLIMLVDGIASTYLTQFDHALGVLSTAVRELSDQGLVGTAHVCRGICHRSRGEIDLAVREQFTAREKLRGKSGFEVYESYSLYQLGELHLQINEYQSAQQYFLEGLDLIEGSEHSTGIFRLYIGLGQVHMKLDELKRSQQYIQQALGQKELSKAEISRGLCDLGDIHRLKQQYQEAEKCLEQSLKMREEAGLENAAATSYVGLGEVKLLSGNANEAVPYLHKGIELAKRHQSHAKVVKATQLLAQANVALEKYEEAASFFVKHAELKEELGADQERRIFALKNKQIADQKEEIEQKNVVLSDTLNELSSAKRSRKSWVFSIVTVVVLVLLSEIFLDPLVESYAYNEVLSLGAKVAIALLLKPIESVYERVLLRKALEAGVQEN